MVFINEDHLRITKVRTADGQSPIIGEDEKPLKKIIFAPLNPQSKKLFEEQNSRLPTSLKMKIETVKGYKPEPVVQTPVVDVSEYEKRIADLELQNKQLMQSQLGNKEGAKENGVSNQDQKQNSKTVGNDSK